MQVIVLLITYGNNGDDLSYSRNPTGGRWREVDREIRGRGKVIKWPKVLHVCAKQPSRISEESLANRIKINNVYYWIKGLVHHRGDGQMSVSVKRSGPGGWHELGKDSEPQQNGNRDALLSDVVLIQLIRASQEDPSTSSGLAVSKYFIFHFAKKRGAAH